MSHLDAVNDNRPPTDKNENGMEAAGGVMKAAGSVMKITSDLLVVHHVRVVVLLGMCC
jgi:hypothetical protein